MDNADEWIGITIKATTAEHNAFMQYQVDTGIIESREPWKKFGSSTCKFCATPELHWIKDDKGSWRLFDNTDILHECLISPSSYTASLLGDDQEPF